MQLMNAGLETPIFAQGQSTTGFQKIYIHSIFSWLRSRGTSIINYSLKLQYIILCLPDLFSIRYTVCGLRVILYDFIMNFSSVIHSLIFNYLSSRRSRYV